MSEDSVELKEHVNWPLRIVIGIMVGILVIGGAIAAYIAISSTPKNKYFLAERSSMEFMQDAFHDRYEHELNWREQTQTNPARSTYELSAQYNDPSSEFDMFDPAQFINHSTLTFTTERDPEDKKLATTVNADLGNIEIGDFSFHATNEEIMFGLPFLQEVLLVKGDDIGSLLNKIDPEIDPNDVDIDLNVLFDGPDSIFTEEHKEHIEKEYFDMIYDEISEDAFDTSNETVDVHDRSIKAEKIEFHLTEEELKDLIALVIDKMSEDEVIKELIRDTILRGFDLGMSLTPVDPHLVAEVDMLMDMYEEVLQEMKNEIGFMMFKDGITSTLWIHKDLIVKRQFEMNVGTSEDDLVTLAIDGSQLLEKDEQFFDYDIAVSDPFIQESFNIAASFTDDGGKSNDSIILSVEDDQVSYNSEESLDDNEREFERSITFEDSFNEPIGFVWSGNATYERDKMNSDHQLSLDFADINEDVASLNIAKTSELIKEIDMADEATVKDLGDMSDMELMQFIEHEVPAQFEQWIFGLLGGGMFGF